MIHRSRVLPYKGIRETSESVGSDREASEMPDVALFSAVGTPLTPDETLRQL